MKIKVKTHPSSSKEEIKEISEGEFEVWIKEKPLDNKANIYLEKFLRKYFGKKVKVIFGLKSKNKIVELR